MKEMRETYCSMDGKEIANVKKQKQKPKNPQKRLKIKKKEIMLRIIRKSTPPFRNKKKTKKKQKQNPRGRMGYMK